MSTPISAAALDLAGHFEDVLPYLTPALTRTLCHALNRTYEAIGTPLLQITNAEIEFYITAARKRGKRRASPIKSTRQTLGDTAP